MMVKKLHEVQTGFPLQTTLEMNIVTQNAKWRKNENSQGLWVMAGVFGGVGGTLCSEARFVIDQ